ncbi:ABC-2 type transport system ATP-binding protein [Actinoalloteichus hoggarensis]|uniref:Daunorubicin/doxorubicin resistance ATP-binding protein DrrA n=1 Tax=Actinoalloteichus hoggarensis TaxID=1470176 RepID=A0A221VZ38_9PSEU|nr:ABC transporter ATP-binding protein [Actinoalloteichus hoggarensis]ASO18776.1 Daunorubicin/doxorubicin resistance ATP-binding protein DrrA [Actinoalloteichus hoggarensis]MBB5920008.1 ABC-2 type transport system ATP-binding protein [Actinoalloteichus hoggarensis]
MSSPALEIHDLTRVYATRGRPDRRALDRISATFSAARVHGLLGPNGAGKTTLCRIVSTVLLPTDGRATVLGHDVVRDARAVRQRIGVVFGGDRGLYGRLTATENLRFWAALHGVPGRVARTRVPALLDRVGLLDRADVRVETFSRGMKQRLHLARGLVADPPLLLLDEPTVGMDPISALEFRELVRALRSEGRTILLTTHDMAEAEAVCDSITFVDGGRIVGSGTPAEARSWLDTGRRIEVRDLEPAAAVRLAEESARLPGVVVEPLPEPSDRAGAGTAPTTVVLRVETPDVADVLTRLVAAGHTSLVTGTPSLQDVYVRLLGTTTSGRSRGMDVS